MRLLFWGDQPYVSWVERLRLVIKAFIGLLLVVVAAKFLEDLVVLMNG